MLEVRENEIALRKLFGGTGQLRNLDGILFRSPCFWTELSKKENSTSLFFHQIAMETAQ